MATERNIKITLVNGKEVINNIKEIGGEYKKSTNELSKLTRGSDDYNNKLKEVKQLKGILDEHRKSIQGAGSMWTNFKGVIGGVVGALGLGAGLAGAFTVVKGIINSTEAGADKFRETMSGLKEVMGVMSRALSTMDFSNLLKGMRDAYNEGIRYEKGLDLVDDLKRSNEIQMKIIDGEVSTQKAIAKNKQLDIKEREAALDEIVRLEKERLTKTQAIADMQLENQMTNAEFTSKTDQDLIKKLVANRDQYIGKLEEAAAIEKKIIDSTVDYADAGEGMVYETVNLELRNKLMAELTDEQRELIELSKLDKKLTTEKRDLIAAALKENIDADNALKFSEESLIRLRNSLYNELIKEADEKKKIDDEEQKARDKKAKEEQEARDKYIQEEKTLVNKIADIREKLGLERLSGQAKEIQEVKNNYAALITEAEGHTERIKELEELRGQEINAINEKYAIEAKEKRADVEKQIEEMLMSSKDKEVAAVMQKYKDLIKLAEQFGFDTSELFAKMQEEVNAISSKYTEDPDQNIFKQMFGLTEEGWEELNEMFDTTFAIVSELGAAFQAYSDLKRANDEAEMQEYEKNANKKKDILQQQLDRGVISQQQYAARISSIDKQTDKKKADMMREQAERDKKSRKFGVIIDGAAAAIRFLADPGGYAGIALAALAAVTAGIEYSAIDSEPIPEYATGGRIKRDQVARIGEKGEEFVLSNKTVTDPQLGPMAEYIMQRQEGKTPAFPLTSLDAADNSSISRAMDFNAYQRAGGSFSQPVVNNYYTSTTQQQTESIDNSDFAKDIRDLKNYMSDPKNRQAFINYDLQQESEKEMAYLDRINKF